MVKPAATVELPCFSWFWSDDVRIACPPGIDCFIAGKEYSHGGLSLQECVVPQLAVQAGTEPVASAKIESFNWSGLRCRVKVDGDFDGCTVDLAGQGRRPDDLAGRGSEAGGQGRNGVAGGEARQGPREGTATTLVLLDLAGNVLEKTPVTVGG